MQPYTLIRSDRKTLAIQITPAGEVLVRSPRYASKMQIESFLLSKQGWIEKHCKRAQERQRDCWEPTAQEAEQLIAKAKELLPVLINKYAEQMGLWPTHVTITGARTRFGSCSGKNRISFSWRLMAYPQPAIEYVVVHELAHIQEKNHSANFYKLVAQYLPDYKEREAMLKKPPVREEALKGE